MIRRTDSGDWKTATVALPADALTDRTRLRIALDVGTDDLAVRFLRLVRADRVIRR